MNLLWIRGINLISIVAFRELTMDSLTVPWIQYLSLKFTMNSLSVSLNHYWSIFFREFTIDLLLFSWFTRFYFLFHEFSINSIYDSDNSYWFIFFREFKIVNSKWIREIYSVMKVNAQGDHLYLNREKDNKFIENQPKNKKSIVNSRKNMNQY